ncbi:hypothetical protein Psuf_060880 [Phytohabitans suffuscus]|uniref:Uncharacterized protein n=1 Tax=Phytohabitans suffuscus TaxID=624315 RepID=A0A6F8YRF8_9ACTN|nr:hypothetical protein Psuf_060880 [Phytohabitans suffuscus]
MGPYHTDSQSRPSTNPVAALDEHVTEDTGDSWLAPRHRRPMWTARRRYGGARPLGQRSS